MVSAQFVRLLVTSSPSGGGKVTVQRCKPGQFACQHSDQCVPVSVLCDGRLDCKDHSDEINCGRNYNVCAAEDTTLVMRVLYLCGKFHAETLNALLSRSKKLVLIENLLLHTN
uniref:Uncharacterized protein n=1 Tax=Seriola lalandi dorsalis TaxID=1841481 RepID=A0A3B4XYV5_SERLL